MKSLESVIYCVLYTVFLLFDTQKVSWGCGRLLQVFLPTFCFVLWFNYSESQNIPEHKPPPYNLYSLVNIGVINKAKVLCLKNRCFAHLPHSQRLWSLCCMICLLKNIKRGQQYNANSWWLLLITAMESRFLKQQTETKGISTAMCKGLRVTKSKWCLLKIFKSGLGGHGDHN